jgi:hypothetical protein
MHTTPALYGKTESLSPMIRLLARSSLQVSQRQDSSLAGKLVSSALFSQLHQVQFIEVAYGTIMICSTGSKLLTQAIPTSANSLQVQKDTKLTNPLTNTRQDKTHTPHQSIYKGDPSSCPSCTAQSHQHPEAML